MGSKTTKTNTTSNAASTSATTPTNPVYVDSALSGLTGNISALAGADPYSFVAGPDQLQTQAGQGASNLTPSPLFTQGAGQVSAGATGGPNLATGASALDNLQSFIDPNINNVVNTTLAGFDQNAARTRSQQSLDLTRSGAFGGSGSALAKSLTEGTLAQDRASTEANLRSAAFTQGMTAAQADAAQRQQASEFNAGQGDSALNRLITGGTSLAGIGTAQGNNDRANITSQSDIGSILQQLAQTKAGAPLATSGALSSILGSLPLSLVHGTNTDGTVNTTGTSTGTESGASLSDWLSYFAANAKAAAQAGG